MRYLSRSQIGDTVDVDSTTKSFTNLSLRSSACVNTWSLKNERRIRWKKCQIDIELLIYWCYSHLIASSLYIFENSIPTCRQPANGICSQQTTRPFNALQIVNDTEKIVNFHTCDCRLSIIALDTDTVCSRLCECVHGAHTQTEITINTIRSTRCPFLLQWFIWIVKCAKVLSVRASAVHLWSGIDSR